MSTKVWEKIDSFYPLLVVVLLVMAAFVIFTFRSVFSAISTAYEIEVEVPDAELRIDKDKLNQAHEAAFSKEVVPLEIR